MGFQITPGSFRLEKPPEFSSLGGYFIRDWISRNETLIYKPHINVRMNIYESGIYIYIQVFADIGYSGISNFDVRVNFNGTFTYATQSTDSLVTATRISNIAALYSYADSANDATVDRGEVLLATIGVNSGQSETVDDDFDFFVPTAIIGYEFTYSKNDFST